MPAPNWKVKTEKDEGYKAYIRKHACCACGYSGQHSVPHHENEVGKSTMGGKTDDKRCLPLCVVCHNDRHTEGRSIWGVWKLDPEQIIAGLQAKYVDKRKP